MKQIDFQAIIDYYNQGLSDREIGEKLNVGRKLIGKYRKQLNLPSLKERAQSFYDSITPQILEFGGKMTDIDLAKKLNTTTAVIEKLRHKLNIPTYKIIDEKKERKLLELYNEGKMDSEISELIGVNAGTIQLYRKKNNLKTKFSYDKISKIDNNKFEELFNKGLSDYAIAKELNMSPDGVYSHRMRYNYIRKKNLRFNEPIQLTQFQKEVLIGTMLGDASFKMSHGSVNPAITCAHGIKQKEYCEYKTSIFSSLKAKCTYHKRNKIDKRTGIYYEDYTMLVPANPEFTQFYKKFYVNKKKVIPIDLLEDFSAVSLAFMYMDDGNKHGETYKIATCCFDIDDLNVFKKMLFIKFDIECSIHKDHTLYIRCNSAKRFKTLISPYIISSMQYKL